MDFEVAWTEAATADLQAITKYIAEHNSDAAERIALAIHQRVSLLRSVPLMGKVYSRGGRPDVRVVVSGKYRIFYRVIEDEKRVEVLTVWHSSRQEPTLPD